MRMILSLRWLLPCVYAVSVVVLIAVIVAQNQRLSKLRHDYAYVEPLAARLTRENADLKQQAEAWEREAVHYREKYGSEVPATP